MDSVKLPAIYQSDEEGACLQDFETTLQAFVTPQQLLGALNFSVLWNPVTYIYDTAIGDNPHIIESALATPGSTKHKLFNSVSKLIENGAVKVLTRNVVQVHGSTVFENPTISEIYKGWRIRDGKDKSNFTCQRLGNERDRYNKNMDRLFDANIGAIKFYDPNRAKPEFRSLIRHRLDTQDAFRSLLFSLPTDIVDQFLRTCENEPMMTTVDLWRIVSPLAVSSNAARQITHELGYLNQQAIARSVNAGISGSDTGHGYQPSWGNSNKTIGELKIDDILDQADLELDAPALEILGSLNYEDISKLRLMADKTIFCMTVGNAVTHSELRKQTAAAMRDYWREVCTYVDIRLPNKTKSKVKAYAYIDQNIPNLKRLYNRNELVKEIVELAGKFIIKVADSNGILAGFQNLAKRASIQMLYTKSDEFRNLEALRSPLWTPRAAWSNQDS